MLKDKRQYTIGRIILVLIPLSLLLCPSCRFREQEFLDFLDLEAGKNTPFKVYAQHETDLTNGLPYNCYLPDGTPAVKYTGEEETETDAEGRIIRRTNSTTASNILQELMRYYNQNKVIEIAGTYPSIV